MSSHRFSIGFGTRKKRRHGRILNSFRLRALSLWNIVLGLPCNKDRTMVCYQMVVNVYQRHLVIKPIPSHDPRSKTGLMLGEMNCFVYFLRLPPYPSTVIIPPRQKRGSTMNQTRCNVKVHFR
ncbi:hypothetical protein TNCV_3399381 [Trichonephila clavipes]|nr:hypothetical protein TNCV_3399381 [Trichonephila clavipes]